MDSNKMKKEEVNPIKRDNISKRQLTTSFRTLLKIYKYTPRTGVSPNFETSSVQDKRTNQTDTWELVELFCFGSMKWVERKAISNESMDSCSTALSFGIGMHIVIMDFRKTLYRKGIQEDMKYERRFRDISKNSMKKSGMYTAIIAQIRVALCI